MSQISPQEVISRGIMVDVETGGKTPARYPLLSIGACVIGNPRQRFYVELQPDIWNFDPAAQAVHKLDPYVLRETGLPPKRALRELTNWVLAQTPNPLFVAHCANFDWMFVACNLDRYEVDNPFDYWAFDTKAAYGSIMHTPVPHHAGEDSYLQTLDLLRFFTTESAA